MELRSYGEILRRRVRVIAMVGVVTVLVGSIGTFLLPPVYVASTTLRLRTSANLSVDTVSYDSIMYATRLLNTYSKIVTDGPIQEQMRSRLDLTELPRVTVDVPANSELMQISVENRSPTVAADAANTLAELLIAHVRQLDISAASTTREALDRQLARLREELDQSRAAPTDSLPTGSAQPAPADLLQQAY